MGRLLYRDCADVRGSDVHSGGVMKSGAGGFTRCNTEVLL